MGTKEMEFVFVGIYGHDQNEVLRSGLGASGHNLTELELNLPLFRGKIISLEERIPPLLFAPITLLVALGYILLVGVHLTANFRTIKNADVIIVPHLGDVSVIAAKPFAMLFSTPLIYFSHNGLYTPIVENREVIREQSAGATLCLWLDRFMHSLADSVIVFSKTCKEIFIDRYNVPEEKYRVIYVSAVEERFDNPEQPSDNESVDVLYWGHFHAHHGVQTIVESAEMMPDIQFVLLGDGGERETLQRYSLENDVTNVSFPGRVSDAELAGYIKAANISIAPIGDNPQTEFTIGTKTVEAAYLSKSIIACDAPAIREVFSSGKDCVLVEPENSLLLAETVYELLENDSYRAKLGQNAKQTYEAVLAPNIAIDRLQSVVEQAKDAQQE